MPYQVAASGEPVNTSTAASLLSSRLLAAMTPSQDSPIFQLLDWVTPLDIAHAKTDDFREQADYSLDMKQKLAGARREGLAAVKQVEQEIGDLRKADVGVVVDLFLSYRAVSAWNEMIDLVPKMSPPLAETVMIRSNSGWRLTGCAAETRRRACCLR